MKIIVVYKTVSGFTKKYAEWITEEFKCDIYSVENVNIDKLLEYDMIIYGGSLHAVGISGVNIIKKNLDKLKNKRLIVFTTGASPLKNGIIDEVKNANFSEKEQEQIKFYYLRGGFDFDKLNFINKVLMTFMKWKIKLTKKEKRTDDEKGMLSAFDKPKDFTKKERLKDLFDYVSSLKQ